MSICSVESSRMTSPDPGYATCEETHAKLLIYPDSLSVAEVSNILKLEFTGAQKKGEEIVNSRRRTRVAKKSLWILSSEGHVNSRDLRHHLSWLIGRLELNQIGLMRLQRHDGLKMTVSCVWWSALGHGGPVLWPEQMKALANLNLECSFDIYFSDDD